MTHGCLKNLVVLMFCTMLVGTTRSCLQFEYVLRTDQGEECCPKCVPGHRVKTHCTEWQSTSCIACDEGTYMDKYNGEKQCFQCLNCAEGTGLREISSCINTRNTVCEPLEGFFCVSGSVDRCVAAQQHSTCAPGRYISTAGTSSTDTVCGDCSEGTFSDGTFKSCQNHTQCSRLQQPGTISSDSAKERKPENPEFSMQTTQHVKHWLMKQHLRFPLLWSSLIKPSWMTLALTCCTPQGDKDSFFCEFDKSIEPFSSHYKNGSAIMGNLKRTSIPAVPVDLRLHNKTTEASSPASMTRYLSGTETETLILGQY
ncbi:tumor necrosis factor receptor superfamily member 4-like isoform X2 [Synchiropus splendidus]|uniref:tumor necrosis factor receptor superfamily member 4-like isoform X2 n=1 Tax=Synchiropus splendidus TaxID=270530 RepID=UPI00237E5230|nr:tumor necrosis factor receptor superfamily member 4-like isoform X2 [Synchiropus splendidus]